jgi:Gluconate 2-dehydrogenase subunit 3
MSSPEMIPLNEPSERLASGSGFSPAQCATLECVLDLIVPPSEDGRMPGATEVGVPAYLLAHCADALPVLRDELDWLDAQSKAGFGQPFASLGAADRQAIVDATRAQTPDFMSRLALETVTCYYQHDRVLAALGMEVRPPAPQGFKVISGDLMLLAPVRKRGKMYRDV